MWANVHVGICLCELLFLWVCVRVGFFPCEQLSVWVFFMWAFVCAESSCGLLSGYLKKYSLAIIDYIVILGFDFTHIYIDGMVFVVTGLSFECVVFLMLRRLCHMCVVCQVYVECIFELFFFFMVCICSLHWTLNVHPVCVIYLNGHSLPFNWHIPLWLCAINNFIHQINTQPITYENKGHKRNIRKQWLLTTNNTCKTKTQTSYQ
jgi:hypothetical protein